MEYHRVSVDQYDRMIQHGILKEDDRVELIRGRLLEIPPASDAHVGCVNRLNAVFQSHRQSRWIVGVHDPIRLADSKPEPDVTLLKPRDDFYAAATPVPDDVVLLIEVADDLLDFDRDVKLPLYAEAGIAEYWIVNLIDSCVEVHRGPRPDGTYADSRTVAKGGTVSIQGLDLSIDQLF